MSPADIPQHILAFVAASIDSVPQMEALVLLWENQARAWSVEEIAARIYVSKDVAAEIVSSLQRRHFIRAEDAESARWRYDASNPNGPVIAEVAAAYRTHLVPLATYIHSKASASVREFARAFDLKKDR
jgi:hypothetical protein